MEASYGRHAGRGAARDVQAAADLLYRQRQIERLVRWLEADRARESVHQRNRDATAGFERDVFEESDMIQILLLGGMAALAAPLAAQTSASQEAGTPLPYDLGRDNDSPRSNAGALESRSAVAAANRQALAESAQGGTVLADDQARYAADVAAYHAAVRQHGRDVAVSARQERAYAMAMADWRAQVDACDRGRRRACEAPAPNPADYW